MFTRRTMINGIFLQGWFLTVEAFLCLLLNNFPTKCCLTSLRLITATAGTFVIWWSGAPSPSPQPVLLSGHKPIIIKEKQSGKVGLHAKRCPRCWSWNSQDSGSCPKSFIIINRQNEHLLRIFFSWIILLFSPFLCWTKKVAETFF